MHATTELMSRAETMNPMLLIKRSDDRCMWLDHKVKRRDEARDVSRAEL